MKRDRDGVRPARYESMKEMAAQTGIPFDLLKHSKEQGCTFNSNNRYDLLVWTRWYFSRPDAEDGENWDRRKKKVDALLKERDLETKDRDLIRFDSAARFVRHLVRELFFGALERYEEEFPVTLKAKDSVDIHLECKKQFGMVRRTMETDVENWLAQEGPKKKDKS